MKTIAGYFIKKSATICYYFAVVIFAYFSVSFAVACVNELGKPCLPPHLYNKAQDDYLLFGSLIKRRWVAFRLAGLPIMVAGNQSNFSDDGSPKPIPMPGEWQLSFVRVIKDGPFFLPYYAITSKKALHFRIAMRRDDLDGYFIPSITIKRLEHLISH